MGPPLRASVSLSVQVGSRLWTSTKAVMKTKMNESVPDSGKALAVLIFLADDRYIINAFGPKQN